MQLLKIHGLEGGKVVCIRKRYIENIKILSEGNLVLIGKRWNEVN